MESTTDAAISNVETLEVVQESPCYCHITTKEGLVIVGWVYAMYDGDWMGIKPTLHPEQDGVIFAFRFADLCLVIPAVPKDVLGERGQQ